MSGIKDKTCTAAMVLEGVSDQRTPLTNVYGEDSLVALA